MTLANPLGAYPELFGPFYVAALLGAYLTAAVMGYRRGWPPASWLLVLAAAGLGGIVGTRVLPIALDAVRALIDGGIAPEASVKRIPGAIAGALLGAEVARRALGIRQSVLEPLAYSGLVALVLVRVGCLLAGCCFGTPTDGVLGATYASGSFVHGFHIAEGVVGAGAAGPHAVHPVPLYDIVFALGLLALLPAVSRRLRIAGNLCWATVGAYAVHRFAQDFVRAREVEAFAGLTSVQVAMAVTAVLALGWVLLSERRARQKPALASAPLAEAPVARLVGLLVALLAARVALDGWLTAPESVSLFVRLLPAAGAVAVVLWRHAAAPHLRWTATALAAGLPLVMGFQILTPEADSTGADGGTERFTMFAVEAHGGTGVYQEQEVCDSNLNQYRTAGVGIAHVTVDIDRAFTRELGLGLSGGTQENADPGSTREGEPGVNTYDAHAYVRLEGKNFGGHFGARVGEITYLGADEDDVVNIVPTFGFRAGPRRFHLQGGVFDGSLMGSPAPSVHFGLGTGGLTAAGQEVRFQGGLSGSGVYASGTFVLDQFLIEPIVAFAGTVSDQPYHVGARVRYSIPID